MSALVARVITFSPKLGLWLVFGRIVHKLFKILLYIFVPVGVCFDNWPLFINLYSWVVEFQTFMTHWLKALNFTHLFPHILCYTRHLWRSRVYYSIFDICCHWTVPNWESRFVIPFKTLIVRESLTLRPVYWLAKIEPGYYLTVLVAEIDARSTVWVSSCGLGGMVLSRFAAKYACYFWHSLVDQLSATFLTTQHPRF